MGMQDTRGCQTSNCTKVTAHESGICHLHRKRRMNAKGEIEWCFPTNCYFKSDNESAKAEFCPLLKAGKKQQKKPIKSFANLGKLLKTVLRQEERTCNKNNSQHAVLHQVVEPPVQEHDDIIFSNAPNKYQNGFWGRLSQIFVKQTEPKRSSGNLKQNYSGTA